MLGTALICTVGLRLFGLWPGGSGECRRNAWNCPDLYGGIATSGSVHEFSLRGLPWNCPDLYGGIATWASPSSKKGDTSPAWNCPDLYGGIATFFRGRRSRTDWL